MQAPTPFEIIGVYRGAFSYDSSLEEMIRTVGFTKILDENDFYEELWAWNVLMDKNGSGGWSRKYGLSRPEVFFIAFEEAVSEDDAQEAMKCHFPSLRPATIAELLAVTKVHKEAIYHEIERRGRPVVSLGSKGFGKSRELSFPCLRAFDVDAPQQKLINGLGWMAASQLQKTLCTLAAVRN